MRRTQLAAGLLVSISLALGGVSAQADDADSEAATPASTPAPLSPEVLAAIKSMGQPPRWKPYAGAYYGLDRSTDQNLSGGGAMFGLYKDLLPSIVAIGASAEGYVGGYDAIRGADGGLRAVADLRALFLKAGVDYNLNRKDTSFILSLNLPLRRGGIFGRGSHLRIDWLPGRGNSWNFGFYFPLEPHMGRTRSRHTSVDLPQPRRSWRAATVSTEDYREEGRAALEAALWIEDLNLVWWDDVKADRLTSLETTRRQIRDFQARYRKRAQRYPDGRVYAGEVRDLHDHVARIFGLAAGADRERALLVGEPIAVQARRALLEEVVFPYNRLLGRFKRHDTVLGLAEAARARFGRWLEEGPEVAPERRPAVLGAFDAVVRHLETFRAELLKDLDDDPRSVWLPYQLVMRPEEHDTQEDIDRIIGRAQGTPFVGGNAVALTLGQQFQRELHRMILETEDYHVLWVHDYDGVDGAGDVDTVGYYQAIDGYLAAMTRRVREYDQTGRFPAFFILVDVNYYEANRGRLLLDLLEDPLERNPRFPKQEVPENRKMQQEAQAALDALRDAVDHSARLQELARVHGRGFLRRMIRVHVNVMNPSDPSFRSSRLVSRLPIVPDSALRDHRKIAFRDLTELDPARGEAIFGGVGVGEQYSTPTWDDRAILVTGPAALTLKDAARRYLKANGFRDREIPVPLRAQPKPPDYDQRVRALEAKGADARALEIHNDRGYAQKDAAAAQIVLYSLAPPGSLIVVPDSIWTNEMWAAQLVGAALRGCHVYVIAPALENAPSAGFPQLVRTREVFSRFLEMQKILAPEIEAAGGALHTGIYSRQSGVNDLPGRAAEVAAAYQRYPFLKDELGLTDEDVEGLVALPEKIRAAGWTPDYLPEDAVARRPKLHRKTLFIAPRDVLLSLTRSPEGHLAFQRMLEYYARAITHGPEELPLVEQARLDQLKPLLQAFQDLPSDVRARSVFYLAVGSMNRDVRGAVLDGEVLFVVSGKWSLWAYLDTLTLFGSTTWVESQEEIDRLIPPYKEWQRKVARWIRKVL